MDAPSVMEAVHLAPARLSDVLPLAGGELGGPGDGALRPPCLGARDARTRPPPRGDALSVRVEAEPIEERRARAHPEAIAHHLERDARGAGDARAGLARLPVGLEGTARAAGSELRAVDDGLRHRRFVGRDGPEEERRPRAPLVVTAVGRELVEG